MHKVGELISLEVVEPWVDSVWGFVRLGVQFWGLRAANRDYQAMGST